MNSRHVWQRLRPTLLLLFVLTGSALAAPDATFVLQGTIRDLDGAPVALAEVYLYTSYNTRRPADFISPKTDSSGRYRLVLPRRPYWGVARVKKGERFGPLLPGDRHSGEPLPVTVDTEAELNQDFTVADLRELGLRREKAREELQQISGRVLDREGRGVPGVYVFARTNRLTVQIPEYLSAWTDREGRYLLYLPPGIYFLGSAGEFPPRPETAQLLELAVTAGKLPVALDLQLPLE